MKRFTHLLSASVVAAIAVVLHIFGLNVQSYADTLVAKLNLGDPYPIAVGISFLSTLAAIQALIGIREAYRESLSTAAPSRFVRLTGAGLRSADNRAAKRIYYGIFATFATLAFSASVTWLTHSLNHIAHFKPSLTLFSVLTLLALLLFAYFFSKTRLPFAVRAAAVDASSDALVVFLSVPSPTAPVSTLKPTSPTEKPWNNVSLSPHNWIMPILSIHHQLDRAPAPADPTLQSVLVITSTESDPHFSQFEKLVKLWFPGRQIEVVRITPGGIDFLEVEKIHDAIDECDRQRKDRRLHHLLIDLTGGIVPCSVVAAIWALEPGTVFKYIYREKGLGKEGIHRAFDIAYEPARELGEAD